MDGHSILLKHNIFCFRFDSSFKPAEWALWLPTTQQWVTFPTKYFLKAQPTSTPDGKKHGCWQLLSPTFLNFLAKVNPNFPFLTPVCKNDPRKGSYEPILDPCLQMYFEWLHLGKIFYCALIVTGHQKQGYRRTCNAQLVNPKTFIFPELELPYL